MTSSYIAEMGIALALTAALAYIDSVISASLPAMGIPIAGVRLGLANIVILISVIRQGTASAGILSVMRSGFAAMTRGVTAGVMSLGGGTLSFIAAAILIKWGKCSVKFVCIISALCHIAGQMIVSCILMRSIRTLYYTPFLAAAAVITGILTGIVSDRILMILGKKLLRRNENE